MAAERGGRRRISGPKWNGRCGPRTLCSSGYDLGSVSRMDALHRYFEASALAFADRGRYVGDPAYIRVSLSELLSDGFAADRRACIDPAVEARKPVSAGVPNGSYDRWGNVVAYTLTVESTGGSGIAVPGWGLVLHNELTDFDFGPAASPNLRQRASTPAPAWRRRS